jgi:hypothetical protein
MVLATLQLVLEYISLGDVVSHAVLPFLASISSLIIGASISHITSADMFPPGGGVNTPLGRALNRYWKLLGC